MCRTHLEYFTELQLHQGPDLTNNLVGVLLRFQQDEVALMADIQAMFHQVTSRCAPLPVVAEGDNG